MRSIYYSSFFLAAVLLLGGTAPATAGGPQPQCPAGTHLVAKFEWGGSSYVFEKPAGNQHIVSVSGSTASATWQSQQDISAIVLKGARDSDVVTVTDPRSGSFTNENLRTPSGQLAGISNVQFCGGSTPPPPPPPPPPPDSGCVECGFGEDDASRIGELTLRYLGPTAHVTVYDHKVSNGDILFDGVLNTGETFTVYASTIGKERIGPKILLFAGNVWLAEIHTSCSSPVTAGLTEQTQPKAKDPNGVADFEIVGGRDSRGRLLCGSEINVCETDQGPPEIRFNILEEVSGTFVEVFVTDDTGLQTASATPSTTPATPEVAAADPDNLTLVDEQFTPGELTAYFKFMINDLTDNSALHVEAADGCDQVACNDDVFPRVDASPRVTLPNGARARRVDVSDVVGIRYYETLSLINARVYEQPIVDCVSTEGCILDPPRESFSVIIGQDDLSQGGSFGLAAADACNFFVFDPVFGDAGRGIGGTGRNLFGLTGEDAASRSGDAEPPVEFALEQNYPNPFSPSTQVHFSLPEAGRVSLVVYDVLGRVVQILVDEELAGGQHTRMFDASGLASGSYVYRLTSDHGTAVRQMVVLK